MDVLITGNDSRVMKSVSVVLSEENRVVIAAKEKIKNAASKRVRFYSLLSEKDAMDKLFHSYDFETAIFFTSRHQRLESKNNGELEELKTILEWGVRQNLRQLICVSSAAVYSGNTDANETTLPEPKEIIGMMIAAGENLCRFYKEKYGLNTLVIHVPFLYGDEGCDLLTPDILRECNENKTIHLDGLPEDRIDFLSEKDLGDILARLVNMPYSLGTGVMNLSSGEPFLLKELAKKLQNAFPKIKIKFTGESIAFPISSNNESARKYYDWVPVGSFLKNARQLLRAYMSQQGSGASLLKRIGDINKSNNVVIILEVVLGFVLMEFLLYITQTNAQYRFIDFRLLFIVVLGSTHGLKTGLLASTLAVASYIFSYVNGGLEWQMIFYNISNWLPLLLYYIAGSVTGYQKDKNRNDQILLEDQLKTLEERYVFIYKLFNQTIANKDQYKNRLLGYRESFGRIYDVVSKLDLEQHEEIFYQAIQVMEDILENESFAIYTFDDATDFARLAASSEKAGPKLSSFLKLSEHEMMYKAITKHEIWSNSQLIASEPSYCAPVFEKDKIVAMIVLWDAHFEQMSLSYYNLFKVLTALIEASLVRAVNTTAIKKAYLNGTHIMKKEGFDKLIEVKKKMQDKNIAMYKLLRVKNKPENLVWLSETIRSAVRSRDVLGQMQDGNLYLLLSQVGEVKAEEVLKRLQKYGIECTEMEIEG